MPVNSLLSPEKIVGGRKVSPSSFQNFISGGSTLGNSVVSNAANNVVGFQRAGVRPATPDLNSIVNTISSNILGQVSDQIESIVKITNNNVDTKIQQVRSETIREIQPLYTKQENNITQLQNASDRIIKQADTSIIKISEDYRKKVSEINDAKPTGILGNFLKVFKGALDFIQFFAGKKNLDNLDSNLKSLQKIFADSFEVAKLIRGTINKIVSQLSNLPTASPSGSPGLNIDLDIPGQGLKQTAPRGIGNLLRRGGLFALGAGGLAAGAGAVNALSDTQVAAPKDQFGFLGELLDGLGGIVESFSSAINSLIKGDNKSGGGGGGGGATAPKTSGGGGGGVDTSSKGKGIDASDITANTPEEKAFIATVREVEGTAGPKGKDTFFGGTQFGGDLSKKTVNEVVELQKKYLKDPRSRFWNAQKGKWDNSAAVGIGQWLEPEVLVKQMGLDPSKEKFTEELQTKMLLFMAKSRGVDVMNINEAQLKKANEIWAGLGPRYGQTKRTIAQSLKIYQENLKEAKSKVKFGKGGPETPDWVLSPEKREELKNMATDVSQPPPSQAAPSVNVLPLDMSTQMPQQSNSSASPSSGPAASAGQKGPSAPFLPAANSDNFLILYSKIIYNIVDG